MYDASDMLTFIRKAIQTRSFSDEEGEMAELLKAEMLRVGFDEAFIDSTGNVVGRIGNGGKNRDHCHQPRARHPQAA